VVGGGVCGAGDADGFGGSVYGGAGFLLRVKAFGEQIRLILSFSFLSKLSWTHTLGLNLETSVL
jgi:hypothetical protein